jgi:Holliday junction resolvase RusA-like endonuclease
VIRIPLTPFPKPRHRTTKGGRTYMPKEYQAHQMALQAHLQVATTGGWNEHPAHATPRPLLGPLAVTMRFVRPAVRDHRKDGDWDNYAKLVCDAANGILWKDDRQIVEAHVFVTEGQEGCIELEWAEL